MTDLYLYQNLHLLHGRVRQLERHVALLDRCSCELFGMHYAPDLRQLERRILAASAGRHDAGALSSFVRLEWSAAGAERLTPAGRSYYEGYALRSILRRGVTLRCDPPLNAYPTPAREAAAAAARRMAQCAGGEVAVLCGSDGSYHTAEGAPLAIVQDHTVCLPPEGVPYTIPAGGPDVDGRQLTGHRFDVPRSVEYELLAEAVQAAGLRLEERAVSPDERPRIDELFWLDHCGITALSHLDGRPLMSLLAERVADALEQKFRK